MLEDRHEPPVSSVFSHFHLEEHAGRTILVVDYRETDRGVIMARIGAVRSFILSQPSGSVLQLTYVNDDPYPTVWMQAVIEALREQKPYMCASAIVGLRRLRPVITAINRLAGRRLRMFDDEESAINFLLGEAAAQA